MQPRFFWRRALAFAIDIMLVNLLVAAVLLTLHKIAPDQFILAGGPYKTTNCTSFDTPTEAFMEAAPEGMLKNAKAFKFRICSIGFFTIEGSRIGSLSVELTEGELPFTSTKTIFFAAPVNQYGTPIAPIDYSDLLFPTFSVFGLAYLLLTKNGQTPGKRLLGLQLVKLPGKPSPTYQDYVKRETLHFIPLTFNAALFLFGWLLYLSGVATLRQAFSIGWDDIIVAAFSLLAILGWYILPLIRWRGQMIYDRLTGFQVIRTPEKPTAEDAWYNAKKSWFE